MSTIDTELRLWLREGKPCLRCGTKDYSEAGEQGSSWRDAPQLCASAVRSPTPLQAPCKLRKMERNVRNGIYLRKLEGNHQVSKLIAICNNL